MILAGSFQDALGAAAVNCREWIFLGNGERFTYPELQEVAAEYDDKTPLGNENILVVTQDGSIGLLYPYGKEPDWYFVSPQFAVVNILKDDPIKYMAPVESNAKTAGEAGTANAAKTFCKNCGAPLRPGSRFCESCGAKSGPEFCMNCGAKLEPGAVFCGNCGTKV